jgi:hypothetical protein
VTKSVSSACNYNTLGISIISADLRLENHCEHLILYMAIRNDDVTTIHIKMLNYFMPRTDKKYINVWTVTRQLDRSLNCSARLQRLINSLVLLVQCHIDVRCSLAPAACTH